MKNLKKISRESLKSVKGGITPECSIAQGNAFYCIPKTAGKCPQDPDGLLCINACNKWCYN